MHYNSAKANAAEQKALRKSLRENLTPAEATLWRVLRGHGADGWKFRRQQGIGPYICDFYCPAVRLCVELDGSSHDYKYDYDNQRTAYLNEQGIRVVRFNNEQVFSCIRGVVNEIVRVCNEIAAEMELQTPPPTPFFASKANKFERPLTRLPVAFPLEGRGVATAGGAGASLAMKLQTPPPTPPLEGRGVATAEGATADIATDSAADSATDSAARAAALPSLVGEGLGVGSVL